MRLSELKNKVLMYIENADERLLMKVSDVFENEYTNTETQENIISEPINEDDILGKPLTLKQYNLEIDKGIDDFKNGRTITNEDVLKEIKSWRNEIYN